MSERITALTMMRDEAPALLEWIAFQEVIGVDRIVVYTNDCHDGTDAMLDRLGQIGAPVIRRDNPVPKGGKPQPLALRAAEKYFAVLESDWLIVLDCDEFINVKVGEGRLPDLLAAMPEGTEGIVLTWRIMGSNGLGRQDPVPPLPGVPLRHPPAHGEGRRTRPGPPGAAEPATLGERIGRADDPAVSRRDVALVRRDTGLRSCRARPFRREEPRGVPSAPAARQREHEARQVRRHLFRCLRPQRDGTDRSPAASAGGTRPYRRVPARPDPVGSLSRRARVARAADRGAQGRGIPR